MWTPHCGAEKAHGGNGRRGVMPRSTPDILGRRENLILEFAWEKKVAETALKKNRRNRHDQHQEGQARIHFKKEVCHKLSIG